MDHKNQLSSKQGSAQLKEGVLSYSANHRGALEASQAGHPTGWVGLQAK